MLRAAALLAHAAALAGLFLAGRGCAAPVDDHQAILDTMVTEVASSARTSGSSFCIASMTDANAVVLRMGLRDIPAGEQWFLIAPGQTSARPAADPALSRAATSARRGPHPVHAVTAPGKSLPSPLQVARRGATCQNTVSFSHPSIQGDLALVEQVVACGDNCFGGDLYALRREQGRWRAYAFLPLWVT